MIERVAATISRHAMIRPGERLGVAVSGGADSVCLLLVLSELAPRWDLLLTVLHLDHGLRGEESRGDAQFVHDLAGSLGLPFVLREARVDAAPGNLEQAGREARMAFFREQIAQGVVNRIALGHTRSDQAETVLFRFLRGAGTAGLAGVRPATSDGIVRPLLEVGREEVEEFLRARGVQWREDSTNRSREFARNRIRHELLPQLARDWNPAIADVLANTADWALAEEAYWEAELDRLTEGHAPASPDGAIVVASQWLTSLPAAVSRRVVRRIVERVKGDLRGIGYEHIAGILELAGSPEGHGRLQVPGLDVFRSFEWLRVARAGEYSRDRDYSVAVAVSGLTRVPGRGIAISLELIENSETFGTLDSVYNIRMGCLERSCVRGPLELRNWRPGDQYQPIGYAGAQKIKTLFQEARIPLWERRDWPVLTDAAGIVWARRFGPDARVGAGTHSKGILRVREVGSGLDRPAGNSSAKEESGSVDTASN